MASDPLAAMLAQRPLDEPIAVDGNDDGITLTGAQDTIPAALKGGHPTIERLRERFDEARQDPHGNRIKAQRDRDYYDGPKQLDSDIRKVLNSRGQPAIYSNRVRPAINGILGVLDGGRMDPRAYPRNPDDEDAADVCTKTLRFIADESKFKDTQLDVAENYLVEGTGAVIIEMDGEKIMPVQIRWEEFYADPYSRRADFKDARYMGIAKWKDAAEIKQKWNVRINEIGDPMNPHGISTDAYDDRGNKGWVDRKRRRVMLIEEYALEQGQWMRIVYIAAGVLEYDVSPWQDERRQPANPIEAVSCYVDRDNERYGPIRDMIPIQDEINARRSRLLHLANSRQIQEREMGAAMVDADTARKEAAKADGVIPPGWMLVPTADLAAGQQLLLAESKSEIDRMGPTPAVIGRADGSNQSGRSRQVLQQAGLTELARPMGRLSSWSLRVYGQCWCRARQFWTAPKFIRVTDDTRASKFLQVNEPVFDDAGQPVLDVDPRTGQPKMQPVVGPDGQPQVDPQTGQPAMQPVQKVNNRLAELEMDIIIDAVPDTANLAQEVWADLLELSKSVPIGTPQWMIALEMSPIADKARVIERIKAYQQEQQGQPDPAAEAQKQLQLKELDAKVSKIISATDKDRADIAEIYFEMGRGAAGVVDPTPDMNPPTQVS